MAKPWSEMTETELDALIAKATSIQEKQRQSAKLVAELLEGAVTTRFHLKEGGLKVGKTQEQMKGLVTELMDHGLNDAAKRLMSRHGIKPILPPRRIGKRVPG
jgi:hypothetical protein